MEMDKSVLKGRHPLLYKILVIRNAAIGDTNSTREPGVSTSRPLNAAAAVARDEDGEAALGVPVGLEVRRERLEPADGPVGAVGVRVRQAAVAVGLHDNHAVLPVRPRLPAAGAPPALALPRPRRAGARVPDGVRLPEPGRGVREQAVRHGRARRRRLPAPSASSSARRPNPLGEAGKGHGHWGRKSKNPWLLLIPVKIGAQN